MNWPAPEVIASCSSALRRMGGSHLESLAVTSALRGEGRTMVAAAAAAVQARTYRRRSVLLELDIENPALALRFALDPQPGVAELLTGEASVAECIHWLDDRLGILPAGDPSDAADDLLARLPAAGLLGQLLDQADTVVADLPPLPPAGAATYLTTPFSAVLLVIRAGVTPVDRVRQAVDSLPESPAVILNGTGSAVPRFLRTVFGGG